MRFRRTLAGTVCALCMLGPTSLLGHHGGAVEWQGGTEGPMTGTATEFFFRFPHVFVRLDVGEDDAASTWTMSTRWTPTILRKQGWTRHSIVPGDRVTVTYRRHISDPLVGQMLTIEVNGESLPLSNE